MFRVISFMWKSLCFIFQEEQFIWLSRTWNEAAVKAEDGGKRAAGLMQEALAKMEAAKEEEKVRREAEEKARREAEEVARKEAEEKARKEAEELAKKQAAEKARREAEELARKEAEEKACKEAEELARKVACKEAEELARKVEEKARKEAETKAQEESVAEAKEKPEVPKQLESTALVENKQGSFSMDLVGRLLVRAELCPEARTAPRCVSKRGG